MTAHTCKELTDGCYRCELNRDEIEAAQEEDRQDAEAAWLVYRDQFMSGHPRRQLRRREFIAGFLAGRTY